jgi:hypothetical protein
MKSTFLPTAILPVISEIVLSLSGKGFVWSQISIFEPGLPAVCTRTKHIFSNAVQLLTDCPEMQNGAILPCFSILIMSSLVALILICEPLLWNDLARTKAIVGLVLAMIVPIYAGSWVVWLNFLRNAPEELYCVEYSAAINLLYYLLPVALRVTRSFSLGHHSVGV